MGPLKPDIAELVVGLICFTAVFAVLALVLLPRIRQVLDERDDAIEGGLDRAGDTRAETEAVLAEHRRELANARAEASRERQRAQEEGAAKIAEARAEAQRVRDELVADAHRSIAEERAVAEAALHAELGMIAAELAGRILGEDVGDVVAGSDVVARFLAEIEERDRAADTAARG